jgi:hypothetical protein
MEHLLVGLYEKADGPTMDVFQGAGILPEHLAARLHGADLDAPDISEQITGTVGTKLITASQIGIPQDLQPIEVMPPLSAHVQQAIQSAAMLPSSNPPQGRVQSRHLLIGAFSVESCTVIQLFQAVRPAVEALSQDEASPQSSSATTTASSASHSAPKSDAGVGSGAANDRAQGEDQLHFTNYVQAFTSLIESPETQPPLVIGIFGSWGAGKSFLLNSLTNTLTKRREAVRVSFARQIGREFAEWIWPDAVKWSGRRPVYVYTLSFNAWEYNAAPKIWPRLVRRVLDTVNTEVRWYTRPILWTRKVFRNARRNFVRKLRTEWPSLAAWLLVGGLVAWIAIEVLPDNFERMLARILGIDASDAKFSFVAAVAGLVAAVKLVKETFFAPFGGWVTAVVANDAAYGDEDDVMRVIREDLDLLDRQLTAENSRVLIVVDDLDRCEPEKAIEVLQAINLMLDRGSFIVALGIDARVITAAVEKHYKELLGPAGITGYEYLDKIVQIPFRIPEPTPTDVAEFLTRQLRNRAASTPDPIPKDASPTTPSSSPIAPENRRRLERALNAGAVVATPLSGSTRIAVDTGIETGRGFLDVPPPELPKFSFSEDELKAFQQIADYLRPNPRHIKRLVNVYALVRALAQGLNERRILDNPSMTVMWLALCAQWPYATREMLRQHDVIEQARVRDPQQPYPGYRPLSHLLTLVKRELDPANQRRFDHDSGLLDRLVAATDLPGWDDLRTLRRFTLNFNPALDSELRMSERRKKRDRANGSAGTQRDGARTSTNA